mgnify:FL=1
MWRYHVKYRVAGLIKKGINMDTTQLKRIADALEEILKLVKQDMKKYEKKKH